LFVGDDGDENNLYYTKQLPSHHHHTTISSDLLRTNVLLYYKSEKGGTKMENKFERTDRIYFHVDVNSAFLSWEAVYRLKHLGAKVDLREVPSAIGGDITKRHGIILAKSIPAKKYNVKTAEPVTDALKKCPNLVLAPPNYELYEKNSKAFMDILRKYSSQVEQYSIDEAFMDVTESTGIYGEPIYLAHMIKDEIRDTLGFTVNIGVSDKKLLAKMASDFTKPDRVHTLFSDEIEKKMWPLPIGDLFFVGRASEKKLTTLGIMSMADNNSSLTPGWMCPG